LIHDEERLNGADATVPVLDGEVSEHEVRLDRVLDEFIVTMIFVLTSEGACPLGVPMTSPRDMTSTLPLVAVRSLEDDGL
jgi:hypothetical protein